MDLSRREAIAAGILAALGVSVTGFANPIIGGGGGLVYPSIHSPNFKLSPLTGWSIDKNGNAYFANITISGSFDGTDWVLNNSGIFFYSGTPALGTDPIFWVAPPSTTQDPFGNSLPASGGAVSWDSSGGFLSQLGDGVIYFEDSNFPAANKARVTLSAAGAATQELQLYTGNVSTDAPAIIAMISSAIASPEIDFFLGTPGPGQVKVFHITKSVLQLLLSSQMLLQTAAGAAATADLLEVQGSVAVEGLDTILGGTAETWHTDALSAGGWSGNLRYRLRAENEVSLNADLLGVGTTGTVVATLPAAYRPASEQRLPLMWTGTAPGASMPVVIIATNGNVTMASITAGQLTASINGRYPLD